MNPNDIARLMNEGAGFTIEYYYTDKHIWDEGAGGFFINEIIERVRLHDLNSMYLEGDSFAKFGQVAAAAPSPAPGLDDTDEFEQTLDDVSGVLVLYKGSAGEEELIAAMVEIFKQNNPDDWLDDLRWH